MRPVCVPCGVEMYCKKNGVLVKISESSYYSGDKYECPCCGHEAIVNFGADQIYSTRSVCHELELDHQV